MIYLNMANKKSFLETAYLLLYGELPNKSQLEDFTLEMKKRSFINEGIKKLYDSFLDYAYPMAILSAGVSALSTFYFDHLDIKTDA